MLRAVIDTTDFTDYTEGKVITAYLTSQIERYWREE